MWTLERKGAFSREAFFGGNGKVHLTVVKLLQEHLGEFMFLCEVLSPNLFSAVKLVIVSDLRAQKYNILSAGATKAFTWHW